FFQAEDGIRDRNVTGVQTCALPIYVWAVIVLLPPSETKRAGGDGPPLRLEALGSPALTPLRTALVGELVELAADRSASRTALGRSEERRGGRGCACAMCLCPDGRGS